MIKQLLFDFMRLVTTGQIEVYNEFSLQHELGVFLRNILPGYKVQFERNTKFFGIQGTIKHEIDIVIYNEEEKHAVELKYPVNGQYPEQMFSFIKDICFMEQLKINGFDSAYCLTLVKDKNFYTGAKIDSIYAFFRDSKSVHGDIVKPTGKKDEKIHLIQEYTINWNHEESNHHFYVVEIPEIGMDKSND